jgi:hypothetical protein
MSYSNQTFAPPGILWSFARIFVRSLEGIEKPLPAQRLSMEIASYGEVLQLLDARGGAPCALA